MQVVHNRFNHSSGYCQCTPGPPPRLYVPVAHVLNTSPEIQLIQVYPWHNTRVSRAQLSTLRWPCVSKYVTLLGLEEGSFVNRPTKSVRPVA